MFPYFMIAGSVAMNSVGVQLSLYSGLLVRVIGGEAYKKSSKRHEKLKVSHYWDDFRAVEDMKEELGVAELTKKQLAEAKEKYSDELAHINITAADVPPEMSEYIHEYALTRGEQAMLFFDIDRRLMQLGIGAKGDFVRALAYGVLDLEEGEEPNPQDIEYVLKSVQPEDWDRIFSLAELKLVSDRRLADKRIRKTLGF